MVKRKDWNLLVLAASEDKPLTPVQLQKILFLIGKNTPPKLRPRFYKFKPYDYGPFDPVVYQDVEKLEEEGKACIRPVPGRSWSEYAATPEGFKEAQRLRDQLPEWIVDYISKLVKWAGLLSFQQLVRAIYKAYPQYREKSVFQY